MMQENIRLSRSDVGPKEAEALSRVILKDGYLGMGQEVRIFEEELQKFLGGGVQVACVNSGTAALHLAVMAVVKPREEVLVPSLTFVASFQAISAVGAIPVACDINPKTLLLDLDDARRKITARTKAIMPVHYSGNAGDLKAVYVFAKKYGLRVIEDAAHAFGGIYQGKKIGSFGDIVCFSFDGIKNITCAEGGAVVSSDKDIMQAVEDARLLGIQKDTQQRYLGKRSWEFEVTSQGFRYHMSNLNAAIGRVQLKRFTQFSKRRQAIARLYVAGLKDCPEIELLPMDLENIVPHIFPVKVLNARREELRVFLAAQKIETGIHYYPNHYLKFYHRPKIKLTITDAVYPQLLSLPLHTQLTQVQQIHIMDAIHQFFKGSFKGSKK